MAIVDLTDWIEEFSGPEYVWFVKRLAANDTMATNSHQVGPYIPKLFLFRVFPEIERPGAVNPDIFIDLYIDSHSDHRRARVVWYNHRTRNETRITRLGGSASALLDPDNTGALAVFVFRLNRREGEGECRVWVCEHPIQEDVIEDRVGPVEPGVWVVWPTEEEPPPVERPCWLEPEEIPAPWFDSFPTGLEIIQRVLGLRPLDGIAPDIRIMRRRECEFELFRSVEHAVETPVISRGFDSLDALLKRAQSILQRRRSRAGRSLELHTRAIFLEEGLRENEDFSWQPESESGKRPDFLFPSERHYRNPDFPDARLRMMAVKTTCKDRWRQVLNEADRVGTKHLLTVQQGVSVNQFREMTEAGVRLVVPSPLVSKFPRTVQPHLQTLESFMADIRLLQG
jgi:hypothetical protein